MKAIGVSAIHRGRLRFERMYEHMGAILNTVREPILVLDSGLRIRLVNKSFCRSFQLSPNEIQGRRVDALGKGAWEAVALRKWLAAIMAKQTDSLDLEMEGLFPVIGRRRMLFNARRVEIADASKRIILLTIKDVTESRQAEKTMKTLNQSLKNDSMTDSLTGLYNRRGFSLLSQHYLNVAYRKHKRIFVLFADLDGMKQINDQRGHQGGDQTLIRTANVLRKTFRKSDIIARIGGDEFAVVTMENGHDNVAIQMSRLQANLKHHAVQNKYRPPISLSIGVARSNFLKNSSIEELTREADALMYIQKRGKTKPPTVVTSHLFKAGVKSTHALVAGTA